MERYSVKEKGLHCVGQELESPKGKFEKLAATKKPNGDASCPPKVRQTKHVSQETLARANAGTVSSSDEDNEGSWSERKNVAEITVVGSQLSVICVATPSKYHGITSSCAPSLAAAPSKCRIAH